MRVLQVHTHYREPGGEDAVISTEAEFLREGGHLVEQFTAANPTSPIRALGALAAAPWNPSAAQKLRRAIDGFRPEVALVHNTWFAMSPAVIATVKAAQVPVVMTIHNYRLLCANAMLFRDGRPCEDCVGASPWQGVRHACYRNSHALSAVGVATTTLHRRLGTWDGVETYIALTEFQRNMMVKGGLRADRIVVKPNPVEDLGMRSSRPSRSNEVLYVGRLSEEKGVRLLVDAWSDVRPRDLELKLLGDGPLRGVVEDAISRDSSIHLEGHVSSQAVAQEMRSARALVFPSRWYEGQPLTLIEALSSGLPVVGSDLGATREVVGALGGEWLVDTTDSRGAWRSALERLADRRDLDETSKRARAVYEERYEPRAVHRQLIRILNDVVRAPGSASGSFDP